MRNFNSAVAYFFATLLILLMVGCSGGDDGEEGATGENPDVTPAPDVTPTPPAGPATPPGRTHPAGFAVPNVHAAALVAVDEANRAGQDCRGCHGTTLDGTTAVGNSPGPSCDSCHGLNQTEGTAWRTDCTFCHGGDDDTSGAPPRYLVRDVGFNEEIFPAHEAHIGSIMTSNMGCNQCHSAVTDVLSRGHMFDGTIGRAEVDMGNGLSPQAEFTPGVGCANSYCHGGGRDDRGTISMNAGTLSCDGCHAASFSPSENWDDMSGYHSRHLNSGIEMSCRDCHNAVTDTNASIANAALHINGQRDIAFSQVDISFDSDTISCSGVCHGVGHAFPWAAGGDVGGGDGGGGGGRVHPEGFAAPDQHGVEMVLQRSNCVACHGADLTGDPDRGSNSCDQCHNPNQGTAWRSNCTFCHGGEDNNTGAPPHDLGARGESVAQSFTAHSAHVQDSIEGEQAIAAAMPCTQCHKQYTDVLDEGHAFDDTRDGLAELDFSQSLSAATTYAESTCSNSYCHGDGRGDNGEATDGDTMQCDSCHASNASGAAGWVAMSGFHALHLNSGSQEISCIDCHGDVTQDNTSIADIQLHVNGNRDIAFSDENLAFDPATVGCSGDCHGKTHPDGYVWGTAGSGSSSSSSSGGSAVNPHPAGYAAPDQHGTEMVLQTLNCTSCHGANLEGGIGNSCDQCHGPGGTESVAWRTDCTFCHGGSDNNTGAPPHDLGGEETDLSFAAHTAHVESSFSSPIPCTECHADHTDVLSSNHAFDSTAGVAETDFTQGLSPATVFDREELTCSTSYCHSNGLSDNGRVSIGETMNCDSCHQENSLADSHGLHLRFNDITCEECHVNVSLDGQSLVDVSLHINKIKDVDFLEAASISFNEQTESCAGRCHGVPHNFRW